MKDYLSNIELLGKDINPKELLLWWSEDMTERLSVQMQTFIRMRVGADDYDIKNPISRPAQIIKFIEKLKKRKLLKDDFSLLDITCADALVLYHIKCKFGQANCSGIDCIIGYTDTHSMVRNAGVALYKGYIQHLFAHNAPEKFDVAIMLNTYRGWESANLSEADKDLPELADEWFGNNVRFTILTATKDQIKNLKSKSFEVEEFGDGEDNSIMICISKKKTGKRKFASFYKKAFE